MDNIILIGMPGAGKSSMGVILAKELGMRFVDTDLLIQEKEGRLLREILEQEGVDGFLRAEEEVIASVRTEHSVIATGGSAVYSSRAMEQLRGQGTIVYLKLSYKPLSHRLGNLHNRGVVLREGQTLKDLYEERAGLYEAYADVIIEEDGKDMEQTLAAILKVFRHTA